MFFDFGFFDAAKFSSVAHKDFYAVVFGRIVRRAYHNAVVCVDFTRDERHGGRRHYIEVYHVRAGVDNTAYNRAGQFFAAYPRIPAEHDFAAVRGITQKVSDKVRKVVTKRFAVNPAYAVRAEVFHIKLVFDILRAVFLDGFAASTDAHTVFRKVDGDGRARRDISVVFNVDRRDDVAVTADKNAFTDGASVLVFAVVVHKDTAAPDVAQIADIDVADVR